MLLFFARWAINGAVAKPNYTQKCQFPVMDIFVYARLLTSLLLFTLVACQSHHPGPVSQGAHKPVAVVGVITKRKGVDAAINRNALAQQMAQLIRDEQRYDVPVVGLVSQRLGLDAYNTLLQNYTEYGALRAADVQALMRANLGADIAVFVRLESDEETPEAVVSKNVEDNQGRILTDRFHEVRRTLRSTTISALAVDLRSGGTLWHNNFKVNLQEKNVQTKYTGSSFAGSLAATFSNTIANGIRRPANPAAPSTSKAMKTLLKEVAQQL